MCSTKTFLAMSFNEIKCHVNTSLGLVGGASPESPPCVRACLLGMAHETLSASGLYLCVIFFFFRQFQVVWTQRASATACPPAATSSLAGEVFRVLRKWEGN